jgi:hypothetical protein
MTRAGTTLPNLFTLDLTVKPNKYITFRNNRINVSLPIARYWVILFVLYLLSAIQFTTSFGRRAIYKSPSDSKPKWNSVEPLEAFGVGKHLNKK